MWYDYYGANYEKSKSKSANKVKSPGMWPELYHPSVDERLKCIQKVYTQMLKSQIYARGGERYLEDLRGEVDSLAACSHYVRLPFGRATNDFKEWEFLCLKNIQ